MNPRRFWELVKLQALENGDWDLIEKLGLPSGGFTGMANSGKGATNGGQVVNLASQEGTQVDQGYSVLPKGGVQAITMYKGVANTGQPDRHDVFGWQFVQDLQDRVAKYGLGSTQVMQIIRVLNTDLLAPFDIRHIAQIFFQPVQFTVFQGNWRQLAQRVAEENMQLPQTDPRYYVGVDALMGENAFSNPDLQATWNPAVLEQSQRIGLLALLKTIEITASKPRYVKITQGTKEPFLPFVEKTAAALEKQIEDDHLRQMLCKQLARDNANHDCRKIIDALPGDPTLTDMVQACSKVGSVDYKMSVLAAALQPVTSSGDGQQKQGKNMGNQKQGTQKQKGTNTNFLCAKCLNAGHYATQCKSKDHANGQPSVGSGNRKTSAKRNCAPTQMIPQGVVPAQAKLSQLRVRTQGVAGMDVHTAATIILESCCVYKVPLDAFGPLGQGLCALQKFSQMPLNLVTDWSLGHLVTWLQT